MLQSPITYSVAGIILSFIFKDVRAGWGGLIILGFLISLYGFISKGERGINRYGIGDNCYFIGFVYTLSIITATLIFEVGELAREEFAGYDVHSLLKTIGIALGTSVIGMLWRFGLTESVKISKDEFDQAVSRTAWAASQLEGSVTSLKKTIANTRLDEEIEAVRNSLENISTTINAYSKRMEDEAHGIGEALNRAIKDVVQELGKSISDILRENRFDDARDALDETVQAHAKAVTNVNKNLADSLDKLNHAAQESIETTNGIRAALTSLQNITTGDTVDTMSGAIKKFTEEVETLGNELGQFVGQQSKAASQAEYNLIQLQKSHENFDVLINQIRNDVTTASDLKKMYRSEFEKVAEESLKETHKLYSKLISGAEVALAGLDNLKGVSKNLDTIAKKIERGGELG